jgi:CRISPR system Cascade subunit CasE
MTYLSRIVLNPTNQLRRRTLTDCYETHRSIMSAFPDEDGQARARYNILFRSRIAESKAEILVQSSIMPDWEKSDFRPRYPYEIYELKEIGTIIEAAVTEGKFFTFNLLACPAKKVPSEGKNSKRVLLTTREDQIAWLARKGKQYGFFVDSDSVVVRCCGALLGRKKGVFFRSVEFTGRLQIIERKSFLKALLNGVGSEKAFGCGLLMLTR